MALAFAETLTGGVGEVPDDLWEEAGRLLGERRRADLVAAVGLSSTWNMVSIATRKQPAP